jgi:hypothetical protein
LTFRQADREKSVITGERWGEIKTDIKVDRER